MNKTKKILFVMPALYGGGAEKSLQVEKLPYIITVGYYLKNWGIG